MQTGKTGHMGSIRFALFRFDSLGKWINLLGKYFINLSLNMKPESCWRNDYVIVLSPYRYANAWPPVPGILQPNTRTDEGNVL